MAKDSGISVLLAFDFYNACSESVGHIYCLYIYKYVMENILAKNRLVISNSITCILAF